MGDLGLVFLLGIGFALGTLSGRWASVALAPILAFAYFFVVDDETGFNDIELTEAAVYAGLLGIGCASGVVYRRFLDRRLDKTDT